MKSPITVGEIIKENRIKLNLTQKQLGDLLYVSEKAVSRWECGGGYPSLASIQDLCFLFKMDINAFLGDDEVESENVVKAKHLSFNILLFFQIITSFLTIIVFLFSLFTSSSSYYGLPFTVMVFNPHVVDGFYIFCVFAFILIVAKVIFELFSLLYLIKNKRGCKKFSYASIILSALFVLASILLVSLIGGGQIYFGGIMFVLSVFLTLIEGIRLLVFSSIRDGELKPLSKIYSLVGGLISILCFSGMYICLYYISLYNVSPVLYFSYYLVTFVLLIASPVAFVFLLNQFIKMPKYLFWIILSIVLAGVISIYVLMIAYRTYQMSCVALAFNIVGIILSPSFIELVINRINRYRKKNIELSK